MVLGVAVVCVVLVAAGAAGARGACGAGAAGSGCVGDCFGDGSGLLLVLVVMVVLLSSLVHTVHGSQIGTREQRLQCDFVEMARGRLNYSGRRVGRLGDV